MSHTAEAHFLLLAEEQQGFLPRLPDLVQKAAGQELKLRANSATVTCCTPGSRKLFQGTLHISYTTQQHVRGSGV